MGFFFLENTVTLKQPTKQQRSIAALNKIGCAACTLNKTKVNTPKMKPTLADETWIYFLGEAPGEVEDKEGKPFIGPSGRLLRYCIPTDLIDHCSFDNIVRDRPPQNRDPTTTEVECCRQYVTKSIEQAKPKIIVGLGAHAQQWMLGSSDQFGMRGRVFAVKIGSHICWFMPTYHPARVLHSASEQAKRQGRARHSNNDSYLVSTYYGRSFKLDIEKARTYINLPPPEFENESELRSKVIAVTDFETVCALLNKAKRSPTKALDIETSTLRPYSTGAAILSVAFSFNSTHFAFPLDHKLAKWTGSQRKQILDLLRDILIDDTIKVAHNCPFEVEWFIHYFGKGVVNHAAWECTQLQAHFLDERRGAGQSNDDDSRRATYQSLDFLIRLHFGCSYKQSFKVDRKQIAYASLTETLLYNATDSRLTLKLWYRQRRLIEAEGLYNAYLAATPRQCTVALMQYLGMPINQTTVKRLQGRLSAEIAVLEAEIDQLDVVKQFKRDRKEFHPMGNDAIVIFDKYLNRNEIKVQDGSRLRLSVDKRVLEKIDHPLAKLIVKLRNKRKMKSTYLDEFERGKGKLIYPDGKIHTNFHTTFTTTGRLASSDPNAQNWPQRADSWVREQVEAEDNCVIVAADYGQLEMCGAAMCSKDPYLVKVLWDDYDTHMFWAGRLAAICPDRVGGDFNDPKVAKSFRSLVKNKLVFPAIYGATNTSIAGYLSMEVYHIDTLLDEFWDAFRGIKKWQDSLLRKYRETGYVEAPTGRRRNHPLTSNEAINAPIQCLASEIVVEAMCRLSYIATTENKWYLHPRLNIHDDLSFIIPEKKLVSSIETIYKTMLTPSIVTDFIPKEAQVPLSTTVSIGKDWYHREEVGKFWSHRDI